MEREFRVKDGAPQLLQLRGTVLASYDADGKWRMFHGHVSRAGAPPAADAAKASTTPPPARKD